jgi:hypothetical protein
VQILFFQINPQFTVKIPVSCSAHGCSLIDLNSFIHVGNLSGVGNGRGRCWDSCASSAATTTFSSSSWTLPRSSLSRSSPRISSPDMTGTGTGTRRVFPYYKKLRSRPFLLRVPAPNGADARIRVQIIGFIVPVPCCSERYLFLKGGVADPSDFHFGSRIRP